MKLQVLPLSQEAFSAYGDVIETQQRDFFHINNGLATLRAFITNGEQGVNYHRNVWHHPLFAWQRVTDFLTIDRGGSDNCDVESIPEQELCFA